MAGTRPLSEREIAEALAVCTGHYAARDTLMITMGRFAGFRISEALSLRIADVVDESGEVKDRIRVAPRFLKGGKAGLNPDGTIKRSKISSRSVVVHPRLADAIRRQIEGLRQEGWIEMGDFVFQSRQGGRRAISRSQASRRLAAVFGRVRIEGAVGSHSLRKSFAINLYEKLGHDLALTQSGLGHRNPTSTISYLSLDLKRVDAAVLSD